MRCVNCSAEIPAGARNCTRCGVPVSASPTQGQYGALPPGGPYAGAPPAPGAPSAGAPAAPGAPGASWQQPPQYPGPGYPTGGLPQPGMQQQGMHQPGMPQPGMQQPGMPGWQPGGGGYVQQRAPMDPALRRRRLILVSAILAFAGGVFIFVACAVPFASVSAAGISQSVSVFSRGPDSGNAGWLVLEPVFVALLAIAAGSVIMVVREGWMPTVARIALAAFGVQTFFLFLGYSLGYATTGVSVGAGGPLGMVAGVALAIAGAIGVLLLRDQGAAQNPNPAAGPAMPPSGTGPGSPVPPYRPA